MYEETADREQLAPQEVEHLVEMLESRAWEVLVDLQERYIGNVATRVLETSPDRDEMLRAQGMKRAFRDLDGVLNRIYRAAKEERSEKELKDV